jgi:uncharacterized membrane protein YbjE (DUF340 family)
LSIFFLAAALIVGALLGWALYRINAPEQFIAVNRRLTRVSLWALLCVMGAKLALHSDLFAGDMRVFFAAIGSSVALTLVFILVFWLAGLFKKNCSCGDKKEPVPTDTTDSHVNSGFKELLPVAVNGGFIFAGFAIFRFLPGGYIAKIPIETFTDWLLKALLFFIGFDLGAELHRLDLRRLKPTLLLVPFLNIALSLAVGLLFGLLSGLGTRQGALLTAGMGWYSLSSVLLAERGMMLLSILAFIRNVFRELLAILCAPLAARISPLLPVYLGGATSMDVMLPFVQRYCGKEYTLLSFYSGVVCSIAVMPLVNAIAA